MTARYINLHFTYFTYYVCMYVFLSLFMRVIAFCIDKAQLQ